MTESWNCLSKKKLHEVWESGKLREIRLAQKSVRYLKSKDADVVEDQYEGGHQLWQGTLLQLSFLAQQAEFKITNVMDVGCGNGLLGIFLAKYNDVQHVVFQDLNEDVLSDTTQPNLDVNGIHKSKYSFVAGPWPDCFQDLEETSFDLIVSSDTVYRIKNFENLHLVFQRYLKKTKDASIYLSGKDLYFGNDGGILPFLEFVTEKNLFDVTVVMTDEGSVNHSLLHLKWNNYLSIRSSGEVGLKFPSSFLVMSKVRIDNPHLLCMEDDTLYHFGLKKSTTDFTQFGDVKFVCCGGSYTRLQMYAALFAKKAGLPCSENISKSDRFCLYKTGYVMWVNHGMGVPSLSIMLNEITKLLYYAGATDVIFIRLGTSGGIDVAPGTVVVADNTMDSKLRNDYILDIAGKTLCFDCSLDKDLAKEFYNVAKEMNYAADMGTTMCANDFYEGQMRLDGAFCDAALNEKVEYLKKLASMGVKNIEMESTCFAAMTKRAGCKAVIICVTLVNRMLGDQVTLAENDYKEFEMRPFNVVSKFISKRLGYNGY
ncbi:unnamed protein product [Bursaphelenchus xylophilus]|uniref:(pine wood nematode) hypothetical protein n=1 Tax=Bursaphelenchus xylophilus TaxID=6326 RepID=A0A1I7SU85_BURXY|nr:unnamed protein product [Bursaphelenchus xylophilus]CAG9107446.1 unnamed protein product [Bursaphelenchus xylophilus]